MVADNLIEEDARSDDVRQCAHLPAIDEFAECDEGLQDHPAKEELFDKGSANTDEEHDDEHAVGGVVAHYLLDGVASRFDVKGVVERADQGLEQDAER
ncbi:unannotated protein [freshwater metagenome]|uniref:Unannotated protein n=1 Tax=freshwater metagenome TaxID=449393 RepID=A0A6J6X1P1_9ZZZZ